MEQKINVIGVGTAVIDDLLILPGFPSQGTKVEVLQRKKQAGGSVPMALKTLSRLGAKTTFIGKIGNDEDSALIKTQLNNSGVDASRLVEEKGAKSPYAQVWINIENGTRTIAVDSGNAPVLKDRNVDFGTLPDCEILHIDGREHDVTKKLINMYSQKGAKISIDTGKYREKTLDLLELAHVVIMPLKFAQDWLGKGNYLSLVSKAGAMYPYKLIIITDGPNGSIASYKGEILRQKAYRVNSVDSTGVGGVYAGGILYGILNNWALTKILRFAAGVSALRCTKVGNEELPALDEVEEFVKR